MPSFRAGLKTGRDEFLTGKASNVTCLRVHLSRRVWLLHEKPVETRRKFAFRRFSSRFSTKHLRKRRPNLNLERYYCMGLASRVHTQRKTRQTIPVHSGLLHSSVKTVVKSIFLEAHWTVYCVTSSYPFTELIIQDSPSSPRENETIVRVVKNNSIWRLVFEGL